MHIHCLKGRAQSRGVSRSTDLDGQASEAEAEI